MINAQDIKKLRELTGAGVVDCKKALEEAEGDFSRAQGVLRERGVAKAKKKAGRETEQGLVHSYIHQGGKAGAMVKLLCETDFVANTTEFQELAHHLAMQIVATKPETVEDLLTSPSIKNPQESIQDIIASKIATLGENIQVGEFYLSEI